MAPPLAQARELVDELGNRANEREGRFEDVPRVDRHACPGGEPARNFGRDLEWLVGDGQLAEHPEGVEVERAEPIACLVPDPADPNVRPRLEGVQDPLAALAQVPAGRV